jgi:hypothetical protein
MIAHDVLTYISAKSVGFGDVRVPVTPYAYAGEDGGPYNPSYSWEMREGGIPVTRSDDPYFDELDYYAGRINYAPPLNGRVPALDVLSLYSAEPDWGMDRELQLSPLQALTAGSQGYRHLRYGLFGLRAGVAPQRALHFHRLALHAFEEGDAYWALRFAARALHYIQDVLTPYHLKPIPEWYVIPRLFLLRRLHYTIYNYHVNFEGFMGYHLWHGTDCYIQCIENTQPSPVKDLHAELRRHVRKSRFLFYGLFSECGKAWGNGLSQDFVKLGARWIEEYEPSDELNSRVFRWLRLASGFVKGYVLQYVLPRLDGVSQ